MAFPAVAVGAIVGTAIRKGVLFVVKRPILSAAGGLIGYQIISDSGEDLGDIIPEEIEPLTNALKNVAIDVRDYGSDLAAGFGNATIDVIENLGVAIVKGLDKTADYVYERTIAGREPDIIAGFTVTILSIAAAVYMYQSVKNANDAF